MWYLNDDVLIGHAYGPRRIGLGLVGLRICGDGKPDYLLYNPTTADGDMVS